MLLVLTIRVLAGLDQSVHSQILIIDCLFENEFNAVTVLVIG